LSLWSPFLLIRSCLEFSCFGDQVGIRNGGGGGLSLQPVPPVMNMSMIFKNPVIGGGIVRRPQQQLPPIPSHPSNMPANQHRTLLLQVNQTHSLSLSYLTHGQPTSRGQFTSLNTCMPL